MNETIVIIAMLAVLVTLQYWHGRRINLGIIRGISAELENILKPTDKEYTWIGGFVGIIAKYKIKDKKFNEIEATISLLPRHSLLYFPFSLLIGRRDRVYLLIRSKEIINSILHIKTGKGIKKSSETETIENKRIKVNNQEINYWTNNEALVLKIADIIKTLNDPDGMIHFAINREENAYYVKLKITHGTPNIFLKKFLDIMS
jgi:uncharacterized FlaG/YvyC family protein